MYTMLQDSAPAIIGAYVLGNGLLFVCVGGLANEFSVANAVLAARFGVLLLTGALVVNGLHDPLATVLGMLVIVQILAFAGLHTINERRKQRQLEQAQQPAQQ